MARAEPVYAPADLMSFHHGVTLELGGGAGFAMSHDVDIPAAATMAGSVGIWVHPRIALLARADLARMNDHGEWLDVALGAVQIWATDRLWLSAGYGFSRIDYQYVSNTGVGFEGRLGTSFSTTAARDHPSPAHTLTLSLDVAGASLDQNRWYVTSFVVGYQLL